MESPALEVVAEKIRGGENDGVEFLFLTKAVEGCMISQETLSELLDFDIFCIDWQEFNRAPKYTVGNFGKVNGMSFVVQEPLVQVLGEILVTLEAARDAGLELRTRVYLPYSSEVHVEYAKNVGMLEEEVLAGPGRRILLKRFDFASMLARIREEFEGLDISIETESWISIFYCNAGLVCSNTWASVYATCVGSGDALTPMLEDDVEGIYDAVSAERRNQRLGCKYVMPTLFSKEGAKSDLGLLKLDNLPLGLRKSYSKHAMQLMSFVQQVIGHSFVESESCLLNFLSMGPTSSIISKIMLESYREMLRAGSGTWTQVADSNKDEVTLLIMDRTLDCISPIYSPILNMNLAEDGDFSRFDDGILEFLDEFMLAGAQSSVLDGSSEAGRREEGTATPSPERAVEERPGGEELGPSRGLEESYIIHEITNPLYLSIMLDPEKLQKDLIISQSYPILSYRFISAFEDLKGLISSGERSFPGPLRRDIINRIDSIMNISPVYGDQSWMFLLLSLNQSQYTRRFWSEVSEACATHREEPSKKRMAVLSTVYRYLTVIQGDIISNLNDLSMKSPSTQTSSSSLSPKVSRDQAEKEEVVIGRLVSILLKIRELLLPDSITDISKKLEDLSPSHLSFYDTQDLRLELASLLKILHYFLIPMFPLDVESFHSIFVSKLRKKLTSSSFESIAAARDRGEGLQSCPALCLRKIMALAISCSSYEGPDCKLTSFGLKQVIESFHPEELSGFGDLGMLGQRLNSIRNARNTIKCKSFRNFQLSPFLPEKAPFKQELRTLSLVSQVSLHVLQALFAEGDGTTPVERRLEADLKASSLACACRESDLQSLRNRLKETRKTLVINIIGNISAFEIGEIERISKRYIERINIVILTDHISSAAFITNSLLATQL